jgi:hypothetical protein
MANKSMGGVRRFYGINVDSGLQFVLVNATRQPNEPVDVLPADGLMPGQSLSPAINFLPVFLDSVLMIAILESIRKVPWIYAFNHGQHHGGVGLN